MNSKFSFVLLFLTIVGFIIYLWLTTPEVAWLKKTNPQETAMMRYRAESLYHTEKSIQRKWKWVKLSSVSPHLPRAVIIAEDLTFFQHKGFDWDSIWIALKTNIKEKKIVRGGSTIPQQLAKNLFLSPSKNIIRKLREALITYRLEKALSKQRILELYLNVVEWGSEIYGIEAASEFYFQKSSDKLSLSEAIRLASVLNNPNRFSPLKDNNKRIKQKQYYISMSMLQMGLIEFTTFKDVLAELYIDPEEKGIITFSDAHRRFQRRLSGFRHLNSN